MHLIVLAPAIFGGRERGRRCVWDPEELARGKGHRDRGLEALGTNFLSFRNFPEAAVVTRVTWNELSVLSDGFWGRDGLKAEGSSKIIKQGSGLLGSSPHLSLRQGKGVMAAPG